MNADIQAMLQKQAAWQRSRAERPWARKLRDSVAMRRALKSLKKHPSLKKQGQVCTPDR
ncbi:hypothetical protein D1AOALGA4SA_1787 [Olavius algarvensis Delta 1 endosymbiont]|nr:hypothetical protein D1AOALGA4SA_1787 [Olavius algarvensis Delta 1 endosymbiont]